MVRINRMTRGHQNTVRNLPETVRKHGTTATHQGTLPRHKTRIHILLWTSFILLLAQACKQPGGPARSPDEAGTGTDYARGFRIEKHTAYSILHVADPWQGASGVHLKYVLVPDPSPVPDTLGELPFVRIPVTRVICMSTTHVAMIEALGKTGTIVGISGPEYISNPLLRERIRSGEVRDVGADQSLDYERIVSLKPDAVIAYGITSEIGGMVRRLGELGIPVLMNGDYLEDEPLGKTEWLKFMASLYGMDREADSIFRGIAGEYERYRKMAAGVGDRPRVMTGLPWKDAWYVPGGRSYAAAFIRDAGGDYIWSGVDSREAFPVSLESVIARAAEADVWINSGKALSLEEIRQTEPRLEHLRPYREGSVYNNTARLNPGGGNDFWETGVMEPHLILADLIRIFHPGLLPGHEFRYYERLF